MDGFGDEYRWLPAEGLATALAADDAGDRFIGGAVDPEAGTVTFVRGDRKTLMLPLSSFKAGEDGVEPDFGVLGFADEGDAVAFGGCEFAADVVLFEADPDFRRRLNKARREGARSFGASLRRLRIQKGLRRRDFAPIPAETIAGLERNVLGRPQKKVLAKIAARLGVEPERIENY
ncbi:helix-turn-helix domain-containing protein [Paludisphaera mucosa]|uniref:Helix-turn-helix transcriptional regulator n=1 Tax=Paludisphaera mucosa TaxID=3030827 RepID=A0ABT6FB96_9BACT|nr:helix-turn-helix transcriptional regulator [Paludisphaera mucosa]MDG3004868.1 helix-turn-helix transcriptional regulator [Paludisphaera mucosa]